MRQLKIAAVLIVAIALQSALRAVWQPVSYVDLTLVLVVDVAIPRLLGQQQPMPFVQSLSYKVIATTVIGTALLHLYDSYFSTKGRQRQQFTVRRRVARRGAGSLRRGRRM